MQVGANEVLDPAKQPDVGPRKQSRTRLGMKLDDVAVGVDAGKVVAGLFQDAFENRVGHH